MKLVELVTSVFQRTLEASLYASALALLIEVVLKIAGKKIEPRWKYALWIPVLLRFLLIPPVLPESAVSLFNLPHWFRPPPPQERRVTVTWPDESQFSASETSSSTDADVVTTVNSARPSVEAMRITVMQGLSIVAASVSALLFLRLLAASVWLRFRLRRARSPVQPDTIAHFARTRAEMRTIWNPKLIETECVNSPGLFGPFRPKLLIPSGLSRQLSAEELRHIFLHELAHLRRGDLWLNVLIGFACALHWFNPFVWLVARRMRLERELACDALVLERTGAHESHAYGETILKLIERLNLRPSFTAVVGILEEKDSAHRRLAQIARFGADTRTSRKWGWLMLACVAVLGLTNAQSQKSSPSADTAKTSAPLSSAAAPDLSKAGVEALSREYTKQDRLVQELQRKVDELRGGLNISEFAASPDLVSANRDLQDRSRREIAFVEELAGMNRDEQRKVIGIVHPDKNLEKLQSDLASAEQQYAGILADKAEQHPDAQRIASIIKTINRQIDERIDGIIKGLRLKASQTKSEIVDLQKQRSSQEHATRKTYEPYFEAKRALEDAQRMKDTLYMRILAEKVDTQVPQNAGQRNALIDDARLLLEMHKYDEAETKLNRVLSSEPDNNSAAYYLKLIHERRAQTANRQAGSTGPDELFTRTFKINPRALQENLQSRLRKAVPTETMQEELRQIFESAGVRFPTNAPAPGKRALFLNLTNGTLLARAPESELNSMESILQQLNRTEPQVTIETWIVEIKPAGAGLLDPLLDFARGNAAAASTATTETNPTTIDDPQFRSALRALAGPGEAPPVDAEPERLAGILTDAQFRVALARIEKREGFDLFSTPKVTTLSKRPARVSIEPSPGISNEPTTTVDIVAIVREDGRAIRLTAEFMFETADKTQIRARGEATLWDGQTLVFWPKRQPGQNQFVIFTTPTIIDPAGNRVHTPEQIPAGFPVQPAE